MSIYKGWSHKVWAIITDEKVTYFVIDSKTKSVHGIFSRYIEAHGLMCELNTKELSEKYQPKEG